MASKPVEIFRSSNDSLIRGDSCILGLPSREGRPSVDDGGGGPNVVAGGEGTGGYVYVVGQGFRKKDRRSRLRNVKQTARIAGQMATGVHRAYKETIDPKLKPFDIGIFVFCTGFGIYMLLKALYEMFL